MNFFNTLLFYPQQVWNFLGSYPFLLLVMSFSFLIKFYFVLVLSVHLRKNKNYYIKRSCFLLILLLSTAMAANFAWILKIVRVKYKIPLNYTFCALWIRLAWSLMVVQYHSLALFIESLVQKVGLFCIRQKILLSISGLFSACLVTISFISALMPEKQNPELQQQIINIILHYCIFPVLFLSLFITLSKLRKKKLPRLLHKQTMLFIKTMIIPFFILDLVQIYPFSKLKEYLGNRYAFAGLSTLILLYAIFYCAQKIIGLRFLNIRKHAGKTKGFDFTKDFRHVLEQFSRATNPQELQHITRTFFQHAFSIPPSKIHLYIMPKQTIKETSQHKHGQSLHEKIVEAFLHTHAKATAKKTATFFQSHKILFADEIAFNLFYSKETKPSAEGLLLEELDADAFIPILNEHNLIGYIVIDRNARLVDKRVKREFYDETERDYMVVFVEHLRNIINLLHNEDFDNLLCQEKLLQQEVYLRHQEINQYKESIQSFMGTSHKKTGIIFYKNRRFSYGNKNAQELIQIDLNMHDGHQTTKTLKTIAQQVVEYKTAQSKLIHSNKQEKLVVYGIPSTGKNNIILLVYRPEISDILHEKMELLNDPSDWSFLLCLETTKIGDRINQLFPGNGETILNFKLNLLKLALGKGPILLDGHPDDLPDLVELLHHINLREQLYKINLQNHTSDKAAIKIFGINPMLGLHNQETPLLEKLGKNGTLFIQDVDLFDLNMQEQLANFIRYGMYKPLQSDRKIPSNTRIICSTPKNIRTALQEGTLSKSLFNQLHKNVLIVPSLLTLAPQELEELICALSRQSIRQEIFDGLLELNEREKKKLIESHPSSFKELRTKLKIILTDKSKRHDLDHEQKLFHPAHITSDPDLIEASQLGKHALRDARIMQMLWKKFKNQNKIALFLGVNRSSVNRRCKKYGLM